MVAERPLFAIRFSLFARTGLLDSVCRLVSVPYTGSRQLKLGLSEYAKSEWRRAKKRPYCPSTLSAVLFACSIFCEMAAARCVAACASS